MTPSSAGPAVPGYPALRQNLFLRTAQGAAALTLSGLSIDLESHFILGLINARALYRATYKVIIYFLVQKLKHQFFNSHMVKEYKFLKVLKSTENTFASSRLSVKSLDCFS